MAENAPIREPVQFLEEAMDVFKDVVIILLFWAMVLAPCMVAMNTGVDVYEEED